MKNIGERILFLTELSCLSCLRPQSNFVCVYCAKYGMNELPLKDAWKHCTSSCSQPIEQDHIVNEQKTASFAYNVLLTSTKTLYWRNCHVEILTADLLYAN